MKNIYLLMLISCLIISTESKAQLIEAQELWTRFFDSGIISGGEDTPVDMKIDANNNIYITGTSNSSNLSLVKYNSSGNQLWYSTQSLFEPFSLEVDASGNSYVTGKQTIVEGNVVTNYKVITTKYDANGAELWTSVFDGGGPSNDQGNDIAIDANGNVYIAARVSVTGDYYYRLAVIKYSSSTGQEQWSTIYPDMLTQNNSSFVHIALDNSGNVYAGATKVGSGGANNFTDLLTIKLNSSGAVQWSSVYDDPQSFPDELTSLFIDPSGSVITGGFVDPNSSAFDSDIILLKYNSSTGAQVWVSLYDGGFEYDDEPYDMKVDQNGNTYVAAYSYSNGNYIAMIKFNSLGAVQWVGHTGTDYIGQMSLAIDAAGNSYLTGQVQVDKMSSDLWTYSFNNSGKLVWTKTTHFESNWTYSYIGVDALENVIVSASTIDNADDWYDFVTIKYEQVHQPVDDAIENIISDVSSLPLSAGNKNALLSKLNNALTKYNSGDLNTAKNILSAFINQLNQFVANGILTSAQAQPLIDYASLIIGEINLLLPKTNGTIMPKEFSLSQNYPNPFNPMTMIKWDLPVESRVSLKIYDVLGNQIAVLVDEVKPAGYYETKFDASRLSSGIYYYRIDANDFSAVKKMIFLK